MDRSLFLAKLVGPTFVAIALGMLINRGMYREHDRGGTAHWRPVLSVRPAFVARRSSEFPIT